MVNLCSGSIPYLFCFKEEEVFIHQQLSQLKDELIDSKISMVWILFYRHRTISSCFIYRFFILIQVENSRMILLSFRKIRRFRVLTAKFFQVIHYATTVSYLVQIDTFNIFWVFDNVLMFVEIETRLSCLCLVLRHAGLRRVVCIHSCSQPRSAGESLWKASRLLNTTASLCSV